MRASLPLTSFALAACVSAAQPAQDGRDAPRFDGRRALAHLEAIVAIGPRPAGSEGAARTRAYVTRELEALGLTVEEQAFDADTPIGPIRTVNLRATMPGRGGAAGRRLIVAGHYDTKRFDEFAFVGANDGGSSTAFLIELARALQGAPNPMPIELVFFDGEEAVVEWTGTDNTYGSRHYVEEARRAGTLQDIHALLLVDMVGDRDLRILRDTNSTPWLTDLIWSTARRLGHGQHFVDEGMAIEDDHLPFLRAGVPAVDIIDLDYPDWHRPGDTLDKVSAESLQIVGDVLLAALPEVMARRSR